MKCWRTHQGRVDQLTPGSMQSALRLDGGYTALAKGRKEVLKRIIALARRPL